MLWLGNQPQPTRSGMLRPLISAKIGQDYIVFIMRFVMIAVFGAAVFLARGSLQPPFAPDRYSDILLACFIAGGANLLFGVFISIQFLRSNAPYLLLLGDFVTAGVFCSLVGETPLLGMGMAMVLIVQGVFRLGSEWGLVQCIGVIVASAGAFVLKRPVGVRNLLDAVEVYGAPLLLVLLLAGVAIIWSNAFNEMNTARSRKLEKHAQELSRRLESMRDRAKALAEMGETLNSTLDYNKILDISLDLGRISLRDNPKQRLIALVLVVDNEEELRIANARGVQHLDLARTFRGVDGVLGTALTNARTTIVSEDAQNDPELGALIAFGNIQSVMVIPLRVEYTTYGVLVYASTALNAFNEDHIDTMQSLGVQATIALKNAILIETMRIEKERLIRIERGMRESLTRDLHDMPTQTMSALAMNLSALPTIVQRNPERLKSEVESLRGIAMRFVEEMRYVMFTWRPLSLENAGLGVSLDQLASKMQYTYKQPMHVQCDPNALKYLNEEQQSGLFYLIEEAANNARKHAEASMIRVKVSLEGPNVVVRIADNGKGFDVGALREGYSTGNSYGMINMGDRAEHVKGTLDLRSEIGKGTTISVVIPAEPESPSERNKQNRKAFNRPQERYSGPISPIS